MTRRRTILATVGVAATAAAIAAPLASAAPTPVPNPAATYPPPCPTQPLLWQSNGTYYVSVPDPSGKSCRITVAVNTNIHKPGTAPSKTNSVSAFPPPCPVQPLAWTAPDGNIVVSVPDPTGQRCRDNVELPIGVPPS